MDHVDKIENKWNEIGDKSAQNALRIKEGLRKKRFDASVQDMEFWLSLVESQLQSGDLGRDLTSVQNLLKKTQAVEAEIVAHEESLNELNHFDKSGKYDDLLRPINARYNAVKKACAERKDRLQDANSLFQVRLSSQNSYSLFYPFVHIYLTVNALKRLILSFSLLLALFEMLQ